MSTEITPLRIVLNDDGSLSVDIPPVGFAACGEWLCRNSSRGVETAAVRGLLFALLPRCERVARDNANNVLERDCDATVVVGSNAGVHPLSVFTWHMIHRPTGIEVRHATRDAALDLLREKLAEVRP